MKHTGGHLHHHHHRHHQLQCQSAVLVELAFSEGAVGPSSKLHHPTYRRSRLRYPFAISDFADDGIPRDPGRWHRQLMLDWPYFILPALSDDMKD
eukprot:4603905-Pyramimonas_sp.AAC.1